MFFKFLLTSFLLCILPDTNIIFIMTQSISRGVRAAFSVTCGLCSGLFFHTAAVALGVAALMAASPAFMTLIKVFGAAYLFWLGLTCLPILAKNKKRKRARVHYHKETVRKITPFSLFINRAL